MPEKDVEVTANFKDKEPEVIKYKVTVEGGTADPKEAEAGATVKVTAAVPAEKVFVEWTAEGIELKDAKVQEITFKMPANDVKLTAKFADKTYAVKVNGGTADKEKAKKGETVTVKTTVPEEKVFINWTGDGVEFADATKLETTFTMPGKDVEVTANFKAKTYAVKVNGGTANIKEASKGETVVVKATVPEGKEFVKWTGDGVTFVNANIPETRFTMPGKDVEVTAHFKEKEYKVSVVGGTADKEKAKKGETITVTADKRDDSQFVNWTCDGVKFKDAKAKKTTFTMPDKDVTVVANFNDTEYTVKVNGGVSDKQKAKKGETVTITVKVPEGKEFTGWTGDGVTFINDKAYETSFVMPAKNVEVTANFKDIGHKIVVKGGTADKRTADKGEKVTVKTVVPEGNEFTGWTGDGVKFADAKATETTFIMPDKDVEITANFKDEVYYIVVKGGTADKNAATEGETIKITAEIPEGKEFYIWRAKGIVFDDPYVSETTFIMPDKDVEITAELTDRNGWAEIEGKWYFYKDGERVTGWLRNNGTWYYMNKDGSMKTGWFKEGKNWFYLKPTGAMATGWTYVDGKWYFMNESGYMQTGWVYSGGHWSYMNESGHMRTGWIYVDGSWFYINESGYMQTGWKYIEGKWYFFKGSGVMATGWTYVDGSWFYMNESGYMQIGWTYVNGSWYYFNEYGAMKTGWNKIDGNWYYFYDDGHMASNITIDGCRLNSSGAWV